MPRRLLYPGATPADVAAEQVAELVGTKRRRSPPSPDKFRTELRGMLAGGDFDGAKPSHLVALYEWCHEQVYGVRPLELDNREVWKHATFAAAKLIKEEFRGDAKAAIEFVRWTWRREKWRESRRVDGISPSVGRIGWRLQFAHRHFVTDYRIDLARGQ